MPPRHCEEREIQSNPIFLLGAMDRFAYARDDGTSTGIACFGYGFLALREAAVTLPGIGYEI